MTERGLGLFVALGLLSGCAHQRASCRAGPTSPEAAPVALAASAPLPQLYELSFRMSAGETSKVRDVPEELYSFSVGRWECALSAVEARDALNGRALTVERSRRVACTHASSATVQSELRCAYRSDDGAEVPSRADRELTLALDTMPPVRFSCEARAVQELTLRGPNTDSETKLCARADGVGACPSAPAKQP